MGNEFDKTQALDTADLQLLRPGTVLAHRYRLKHELGRGGMGVVFRATDEQLDREVAVKVLPSAGSSPDAKQRLLREARAAAALNHGSIVAVHDVGEDHGIPFFVMELVEGPDLHQDATRRISPRSSVSRCASATRSSTRTRTAVVHRDLKPENVLLSGTTEPRGVKLADLGVATQLACLRPHHGLRRDRRHRRPTWRQSRRWASRSTGAPISTRWA